MSATYYVSPSGLDTNPGTMAAPWRTLAPVNAHLFVPGDTILFQGPSTYGGGLYLHNIASNAAAPITLASYGTGNATIYTPAGQSGCYVYNMAGVDIQNLDLTGPGAAAANQAGIIFYNDLAATVFPYIRINNCTITGYTYGISIGGGNGTSGYSDIQITHCDCHANSTDGIIFYGAANYCHTGVYVGYCNAYNNLGIAGASNPTGSGITLASVNGGTIEYCEAYGNGANNIAANGPVGIWCYSSNNVTIQHCESYNNNSAGGDGDGFDIDGGCTGCIIQYCYSHGNKGGGFCLFQYAGATPNANNIIRYNISENDKFAGIALWGATASDKITNSQIYNNTIYAGAAPALNVFNSNLSGISVQNNIFITTGGQPLVQHPGNVGVTFGYNDYYPASGVFRIWWNGVSYSTLAAWGQDSGGISANPQLASPGNGGTIGDATILPTLSAYQVTNVFAPVVNAGAVIGSPGLTDFYGNKLFYQAPDIGANEYYPPVAAPHPPNFPISLIPQTGMPQIYASRSRELSYDTLMGEPLFIRNPFGPQVLGISRPNHHW